jgi:hypothetical protein
VSEPIQSPQGHAEQTHQIQSSLAQAQITHAAERTEFLGTIDLGFLRDCVDDAQEAINSLWNDKGKTFWRSTRHRQRETQRKKTREFYPTVTLRCCSALLSLTGEATEWASRETADVVRNLYVPALLSRKVTDLRRSTLNVPSAAKAQHRDNVFTLAIFVQAFARIRAYVSGLSKKQIQTASEQLVAGLTALVEHPFLSHTSSLHPFLAYHIKQSLQTAAPFLSDGPLARRVEQLGARLDQSTRDAISANVAKHHLGSLNPSEAVALGFCAANLSVGPVAVTQFAESDGAQTARASSAVGREDRQLILSAFSVCLDAQDPAGCWPLGRVVQSQDKDMVSDRLEITTFEVAAAVAEAATGLHMSSAGRIDARAEKLIGAAARQMLRAGRYAERSVTRLSASQSPRVGWCSDHAYGAPIIESWTSATVLESVVRLSAFAREFNRRSILSTFTTTSPSSRDWPGWLRWETFKDSGEVDHSHPVLGYLERKLIRPILSAPDRLPTLNPRSVSVLLFGPPGTSKTTIVRGVADALNWPVVVLSPGNFIQRGLEYIEAEARSVFGRLMQLSRAIVIFDECDELFRDRNPRAESEQMRGITAFVTASMLPKLQDLHDRGRVIFFICTNNFHAMDPAVKRGGRIDHIIGVGPPDKDSRAKIVESSLLALSRHKAWVEPRFFSAALDEVVAVSERFTRSELDRTVEALSTLARKAKWRTEKGARDAARNLVEQRQSGLTITVQEYDDFKKERTMYSHPYSEGG